MMKMKRRKMIKIRILVSWKGTKRRRKMMV
jgi:hypothetical protein